MTTTMTVVIIISLSYRIIFNCNHMLDNQNYTGICQIYIVIRAVLVLVLHFQSHAHISSDIFGPSLSGLTFSADL